MKIIKVSTSSHEYPIFIQNNFKDLLKKELANYISQQVFIVTNTVVAPLYLQEVTAALTELNKDFYQVILPDGEKYKNLTILNQIYDQLLSNNIERQATLIALGGGVIGDMAGFAAATYQRGIPFIQIPTTLLSQVDSSVGGKTAVNHPLGKNMIGAFYQPQAVFIAIDSLKSLPPREFSAGLAEVIKYALLGDESFLVWLENNIEAVMRLDEEALSYVIATCCQMKAQIVAADEKEQGMRALLNLGHTFAHAIETHMGYGVWLHGEAVAAGIVLASQLSEKLGFIDNHDTQRIISLLQKMNLPISPPKISLDTWLYLMSHDKKVESGKIRFIVLKKLGEAKVMVIKDDKLIHQVLSLYN